MKKLVLLCLPVLLFAACRNDIDTQVESVRRLTLNALIDCDAAQNDVWVSLTGSTHTVALEGAGVQVRVNGVVVETGTTDAEGHCLITSKFATGQTVRLDVKTADGYYEVWAEDVVPDATGQIVSMDVKDVTDKHYYSIYGSSRVGDFRRYDIAFNDPVERNFYRLRVVSNRLNELVRRDEQGKLIDILRDSTANSATLLTYEDAVIMEGQTYMPGTDEDLPSLSNIINTYNVFNDQLFNGGICHFTFYEEKEDDREWIGLNGYTEPISDIPSAVYGQDLFKSLDNVVSLQTITADMYYYLKALNFLKSDVYDDNSDLTGPLKLPSNVHGGTGILGFAIGQHRTIHVLGSAHYENGHWKWQTVPQH